MENYTGFEIAIVGASGRFPGAENLDVFWQNISSGKESISFFSEEELIEEGIDPEELKNPAYVRANSYMDGKEYFDSAFFNYRPGEAKVMDPQMRILHEYVWKAIENAGYNVNEYKGKVGLFTGASTNLNWLNYSIMLNMGEQLVDSFSQSLLDNIVFNNTRISYLLNLRGPSIAIDTACSTSLVAVHQACNSLLLGECSMALAGGVKVTNYTKKGYIYKEGMISSPDGHCRSFDKDAGGTVSGEGVGIVVLKKLKRAIADNDNILAVIKGTGVNNDGYDKVGYTAPSVNGQTEAIMMAHKMAKVDPKSITYVEAHGTATHLGDPIEMEALNRAFGESKDNYCAVGSVKSNIGHLDAAAGVAGLIKTVMALKNRQLPPSLHFKSPNPKINLKNSPFYVNTELKPWENKKYPLRAGVSSFGIGGTNAHVIVEEPPKRPASSPTNDQQLLVWSAKTSTALRNTLLDFKQYTSQNEKAPLADIAYTLMTGRANFKYRKTFVAQTHKELMDFLSADPVEKEAELSFQNKPSTVFMFSGQGSQYVNMCKDLYPREKVFSTTLDNCLELCKQYSSANFRSILFPETELPQAGDINHTEFAQPLLFMVEYALSQQLIHWGIRPDVMIGHSIGEYVAASVSEVFALEDALKLVIRRGQLMQKAPTGKMLSVSIGQNELEKFLKEHTEVEMATVNSSDLCVVSGAEEAIDRFKVLMDEKGNTTRSIVTSHAFHSRLMDDVLQEFREAFNEITINAPKIPFVSNLTGKMIETSELVDPEYWVKHLRHTVRFSDGIELLFENKDAVFVEVGPGTSLSTFVTAHGVKKKGHTIFNTVRHFKKGIDDRSHLLSAVGKLWEHGVQPSFDNFFIDEIRNRVPMPTYAFDKIQYPVKVDAFKLIQKMISQEGTGVTSIGESSGELQLASTEINTSESIVEDPNESISLEVGLQELWKRFFGRTEVSIEDNFLEIGGDSLDALTMIGQVHKQFNVSIPLVRFFQDPTINGMVAYVNSEDSSAMKGRFAAIPKTIRKEYYPLSSAQSRMYFLHQFDKESLAYNMPDMIMFNGSLDLDRLEESIQKLLLRHDSLRTSFQLIDGKPLQVIHENIDLTIEKHQSKADEIETIINQFIVPFDLEQAPLVRIGLVEMASDQHLLMLDMHHIITDGTSESILVKDFMALYNAEELPTIDLQYKDYAEWQQSESQKVMYDQDKEFWLKEFSGELTVMDLPTDHSRPSVKDHRGSNTSFLIEKSQTEGLKKLSERVGTTMFTTLLAIFNVLLAKLSNQEDIVVGTPVSGRNHPDLEQMMGMFVNTLSLRNYPKNDRSFLDFLAAVKGNVLASFDHQSYQYEELIEELKLSRDTSRNPLFDVMFSFQNFQQESLDLPGLKLSPYDNGHNISKFDLTLIVVEIDGQLHLTIEYSTVLFKTETINKFSDYLKRLVEQVLENNHANIGQLEVLSESEKHQLLHDFNDTQVDYPSNHTVVDVFEKQVENSPDAKALVFGGESWTYDFFHRKVNQMTQHLLNKEIKQGAIIGVMCDRSFDLMVSIFGALKAGAAYLPIDPEFPQARIDYMLKDSKMDFLIIAPEYRDRVTTSVELIELGNLDAIVLDNVNVQSRAVPDAIAYIIYTSGSTGNPKGVMVKHKALMNRLNWMGTSYPIGNTDVVLQKTPIVFDVSVWELFWWSQCGASLCLLKPGDEKKPDVLRQVISDEHITTMHFVPSMLQVFLEHVKTGDSPADIAGLKRVFSSGEALTSNQVKSFDDLLHKVNQTDLINLYGPSEATIDVSYFNCFDHLISNTIPIGRPIDNINLYVIGKSGNLQPVGVAGELCISGVGLAAGYLNNEAMTLEKFVDSPFKPQEKMYRTGDIAKWQPDGNIEFLGRMDHQVKIRGHRIELGEIEYQLSKYPGLKETLVVVKERNDDPYLVAYYTSVSEESRTELRRFLSVSLPDYMLPVYYVHLEQFPLTFNGKIDRRLLPEVEVTADSDYVAPSNEIEEKLVSIWSEVLSIQVEVISIRSNFFEIGGHSLKAVTLLDKLKKEYGIKILMSDFFGASTIADLSKTILLSKVRSADETTNTEQEPSYKI